MDKAASDHFKVDSLGKPYAGDHLLIELWGCDRLSDEALIDHALRSAALASGATILHAFYHPFGADQGISGVLVLAESHISIHTWPEHSYAAIDIFMCGDCDPNQALSSLETILNPAIIETQHVKRGVKK